MLLTLTTTARPTTDLGFSLHVPARPQSTARSTGTAHVVCPGGSEPLRRVHECVFTVLALESEPVDLRL